MRVRARSLVRDERGVTGLIVVIVLVAIIGMLSLAVDGGVLFLKRRAVVSANDAAALGAALSCARHQGAGSATAAADGLATANVANATEAAAPLYSPSCDASGGKVTVHYQASQQLFFAQIVGVGSPKVVSTTATAKWGGAGVGTGALPLMLSMSRMSTCKIPDGVTGGQTCAFYWDNGDKTSGPASLSNAEWGIMDFRTWAIDRYGKCLGNPSQSLVRTWIANGYPGTLALVKPPPTYACRGDGNQGGAFDNDIRNVLGQVELMPVNDPAQQVDSSGAYCKPGMTCSVDKYAIVGFAKMKLYQFFSGKSGASGVQNSPCMAFLQSVGATPTSTSRCLVSQWIGFTEDPGGDPGGGGSFGVSSVGLSG